MEEVYANTLKRTESERKRYRDLYRVDYTDGVQFDLVIDTATHDLKGVVQLILGEYEKWRSAAK